MSCVPSRAPPHAIQHPTCIYCTVCHAVCALYCMRMPVQLQLKQLSCNTSHETPAPTDTHAEGGVAHVHVDVRLIETASESQ